MVHVWILNGNPLLFDVGEPNLEWFRRQQTISLTGDTERNRRADKILVSREGGGIFTARFAMHQL